jgi:hypothetical protein
VNFAAIHPKRVVMFANCLSVWGLEEAVHLAIRIVKELYLANTEFIGLFVFCVLGELIDRFRWEL